MSHLTHNPIDPAAVLASVQSPEAGAAVLFLGTVRRHTEGRETSSLDYEGFEPMAEQKLAELEHRASERWPLVGCTVIHRLGHLELGEASVAVAVSAAHRQIAFEAGQWLIDTLKQTVPIWKRENWADGTREWVHPGLESSEETAP